MMSCGLIRTHMLCKLSLTICFFVVEVVISRLTGSVAILTDSFYELSEAMASVVALVSIRLSAIDQTAENTFGWARAEVVASLVNAVFLSTLSVTVLLDAVKRLVDPRGMEDPKLLLGAGIAGLLVKLLSLFLCRARSTKNSQRPEKTRKNRIWKPEIGSEDCTEEETNQLMVYRGSTPFGLSVKGDLHECEIPQTDTSKVWRTRCSPHEDLQLSQQSGCHLHLHFRYFLGAFLSSAAVMTEALVFTFVEQFCTAGENYVNPCTRSPRGALRDADPLPSHPPAEVREALAGPCWILYLDPSLCVVTGGTLLYVTFLPLKESALVLLQAVPEQMDLRRLSEGLAEVEGVLAVRELHVWRLAGSRVIATAHIRCHQPDSYMDVGRRVKDFFHRQGVHATTIQPEFAPLSSGSRPSSSELSCLDQ